VHPAQRVAVIAHRKIGRGVEPVFEDLPLADQAIQVRRVVIGHPIPQHVVMRALHHRQRIDLHIAQVGDGAVGARRAFAERRP